MHLRKNLARQKTQHFSKTQGQNPKTQLFGSSGPKSFQVHHKKHSTELFKTKFWALKNAIVFVCRYRIFKMDFWNKQILQLAHLIGVQKFNFIASTLESPIADHGRQFIFRKKIAMVAPY